jgi:hypothetical protein
MTPAAIAATFAAFVDVLIPGDDIFPSASTVGTQGMLAERLRQQRGVDGVVEIATRLSEEGPLVGADAETASATVRQLEQDDPALFSHLYIATCFSYYQHPTVTAAIRSLGHDYNDSPQPDGYEMPKFDFTPGVNVPMKPKGTFKWTDWLEPVDISSLAHLNLPVRQTAEG